MNISIFCLPLKKPECQKNSYTTLNVFAVLAAFSTYFAIKRYPSPATFSLPTTTYCFIEVESMFKCNFSGTRLPACCLLVFDLYLSFLPSSTGLERKNATKRLKSGLNLFYSSNFFCYVNWGLVYFFWQLLD